MTKAAAHGPRDWPASRPSMPTDELPPDRRVVAGRQLPVGRPDLPARQPAAPRAAAGREHVKPRLLGPLGHDPRAQPLYAHLNRVIKRDDLDAIYVIGPGHGGPAIVANA